MGEKLLILTARLSSKQTKFAFVPSSSNIFFKKNHARVFSVVETRSKRTH